MPRRPNPTVKHPGVYVHAGTGPPPVIPALATGVTAFVGWTPSGPAHEPVAIRSERDYLDAFGAGKTGSVLDHAVHAFFGNGGSQAIIVRVPGPGPEQPRRKGKVQVQRRAGDSAAPRPTTVELLGDAADRTGLHALRASGAWDLLSIPDATRPAAGDPGRLDDDLDPARIFNAAATLCREHEAFLLVDPPPTIASAADMTGWMQSSGFTGTSRAAAHLPWITVADPGAPKRGLVAIAPSGAVAGVYARTDATRGVWKAPAGLEANLRGAAGFAFDLEAAAVASLVTGGINPLQSMPGAGPVIWGSRTTDATSSDPEARYVPVRRFASTLQRSLDRGTEWAVFEPNDEPLWTRLQDSAASFLDQFFRSGAFAGAKASDAYFVRCGRTTTTAADIAAGRLHLLVGFAPIRPAEFVVLRVTKTMAPATP